MNHSDSIEDIDFHDRDATTVTVGFIKVYIYVNLTGSRYCVNCSRYLHSL